MILFYFALLLIAFAEFSEGRNFSDYQDCNNSRSDLLKALFETEGNLYELDRVFAPERLQTSTHVIVTYTFVDSDNLEGDSFLIDSDDLEGDSFFDSDEGNCSVTYIWAQGGFLLIQPPTLFEFSSLFFSRPSNSLENLNLTLPAECRPLVMDNINNNTCTCNGKTRNILDRLTQQLNEYTKYGDPTQVVQDITSSAQAVCVEELEDKYFNPKVTVFLAFTVVIPVIAMVIIGVVVRSIHPTLDKKLTKSSENHPNLVGFTLAGSCFLVFVLVFDVIAVYHYHKADHEYGGIVAMKEFNLNIVWVTLITDFLVAVGVFLPFMIYLTCTEISCCYETRNCFVTCIIASCILPYFYCIFGSKPLREIVRKLKNAANNEVTLRTNQTATLRGEQQAVLHQATLNGNHEVTLAKDVEIAEDITLKAGKKVKLNDGSITFPAGYIMVELNNTQEVMLCSGQKITLGSVKSGLKLYLNNIIITLNAGQKFKVDGGNQEITLNGSKNIELNAGLKISLPLPPLPAGPPAGSNAQPTEPQVVTISSPVSVCVTGKIITNSKIFLAGNGENHINQRTIWIVAGLMIAPLFCIASHSGYILAAWVTEPAKTTATFLLALGSFLYMFFMFRQCYIVHKTNSGLWGTWCKEGDDSRLCAPCDSENQLIKCCYKCICCECKCCKDAKHYGDESCSNCECFNSLGACCYECWCSKSCCTYRTFWIYFLLFYPICSISSHFINVCYVFLKTCQIICKNEDNDESLLSEIKIEEDKDTDFSMRGFFLSCSWSWVICGVLVFVLVAFFLLPLPTYQLAQYVESTIQIVLVVLTFMITYRVFATDADGKGKKRDPGIGV